MKKIAIIPARMNSSRFPGKPMKKIHGFPMIGHCYFRTRMAPELFETYVATCDKEIYEFIVSIGGKAVMTSDTHERASDRAAEAMLKVEKIINDKVDIVVMVQGDEPMVTPEMITQAIIPMSDNKDISVVNLMAYINNVNEFEDPNEVKVVVNKDNNAIYFSREAIPSGSKFEGNYPMLKQVCIIPFRRDYLLRFNKMKETPLEIVESIDMLRIIENGENVKMVLTNSETLSVDTKEDLERVQFKMKNDSLMKEYI
jgi:3-deoxy-manno-octulosonate cytidylyltransferase (CMP-KDO synthetase)